ncbi:GntP family permease [Clostridium formicaceticum]|uniref:Gluconate permease n=1 Tax=Clostridium formicaceticum TaxID=1497 RepID=A0AAC9RLW4_9CLOT|nr:gluconate:H+ symporter [Clostridium formicaceticum]AOY76288.1 gluconate permease [Clostridium formicaceticum]ARE86675.1 Gnt-II system L-idonate transporter [Clostridium formicaceticum]
MELAVSGGQMVLGLVLGIILLLTLILKTKVHAFLALIISASVTGLVGGMPANGVTGSITRGFGNTLGSIGIIIGFGVMMGQLFEASGAAERMARTFIKVLGKKREELAMAITGFIVSIPIFCDSGFVILSPLVKAISRRTKKSVVSLGISLALGLVITHSLVPPTPGPVGVAGIFEVSVGSLLLWGIILAIPMTLAGMLYGKWIGKQIYQLPGEGDTWIRPNYQDPIYEEIAVTEEKVQLPSAFMAFAPILIPVILILLSNLSSLLSWGGNVAGIIAFVGSPVIAVGIGLLVAILGLTKNLTRQETIEKMEQGIRSAGIIMLVTGGGGALGTVLRDSGAGDYLAQLIAASPLPAILVPFIVASAVRLIQGSGTVAMITAASITAPMLANLQINPVFAALAACVGSLIFSYFNDSYFWVVNRMLGIKEVKEQIRVWSVTTTIAWGVGLVGLLILNALFG